MRKRKLKPSSLLRRKRRPKPSSLKRILTRALMRTLRRTNAENRQETAKRKVEKVQCSGKKIAWQEVDHTQRCLVVVGVISPEVYSLVSYKEDD
jgi:hypothetical protein